MNVLFRSDSVLSAQSSELKIRYFEVKLFSALESIVYHIVDSELGLTRYRDRPTLACQSSVDVGQVRAASLTSAPSA
jgi:hypothetical protein